MTSNVNPMYDEGVCVIEVINSVYVIENRILLFLVFVIVVLGTTPYNN